MCANAPHTRARTHGREGREERRRKNLKAADVGGEEVVEDGEEGGKAAPASELLAPLHSRLRRRRGQGQRSRQARHHSLRVLRRVWQRDGGQVPGQPLRLQLPVPAIVLPFSP